MGVAKRKVICIYDTPCIAFHEFGSRCVFVYILVFAAWINVAFATVTVSVNDKLNVGVNATFSCIPDGTLRRLTWSKSSFEDNTPNPKYILQYIVGFSASYGTGVDRTHYKFDEASNEMKVLGVTLDDEGKYWCEARVVEFPDASNYTLANITVPPAASTTHITYKDRPYDDTIEVEAGDQTFTCITTGVKPAATFAWTPSTSKETTTSEANGEDGRLFDSSSNTTIQIMSPLSPTKVKCAASNTDDESLGVEITVNLKLRDTSSAERTSFRFEMIAIQCFAWMAFKLMYI